MTPATTDPCTDPCLHRSGSRGGKQSLRYTHHASLGKNQRHPTKEKLMNKNAKGTPGWQPYSKQNIMLWETEVQHVLKALLRHVCPWPGPLVLQLPASSLCFYSHAPLPTESSFLTLLWTSRQPVTRSLHKWTAWHPLLFKQCQPEGTLSNFILPWHHAQ